MSSNTKNPKKNKFKFSSTLLYYSLSLSFVIPSTIVLAIMIVNDIDLKIREVAIR